MQGVWLGKRASDTDGWRALTPLSSGGVSGIAVGVGPPGPVQANDVHIRWPEEISIVGAMDLHSRKEAVLGPASQVLVGMGVGMWQWLVTRRVFRIAVMQTSSGVHLASRKHASSNTTSCQLQGHPRTTLRGGLVPINPGRSVCVEGVRSHFMMCWWLLRGDAVIVLSFLR